MKFVLDEFARCAIFRSNGLDVDVASPHSGRAEADRKADYNVRVTADAGAVASFSQVPPCFSSRTVRTQRHDILSAAPDGKLDGDRCLVGAIEFTQGSSRQGAAFPRCRDE